MKRVVLLAVLVVAFLFSQAQYEKGSIMLSGNSNFGLNFGSCKVVQDGTSTKVYSYTKFDFGTHAGYAVIDQLVVGLFLNVGIETDKYDDAEYKESYTDLAIGPFARYYITDLNGFWPFAEVGFGGGVSNYKYTPDSGDEETDNAGLMKWYLGVGGAYGLTDNVDLDLFLGYHSDTYSYKADDEDVRSSDGDYKTVFGEFGINLGITVWLGK
jgi:hypothetical protein